MNLEYFVSVDEDYASRAQTQQHILSTPLKASAYNYYIQSPLHDPFQVPPHLSNSRSKYGKNLVNSEERNIYASFDIYGNELNLQNEHLSNKEQELESIYEEGQYETLKLDKENNDPTLNIITPLKKRTAARVGSERDSFRISRSPLIDITPKLPKRKGTKTQEFNIEVTLPKFHFNLLESTSL
jgi:hypothetical protein